METRGLIGTEVRLKRGGRGLVVAEDGFSKDGIQGLVAVSTSRRVVRGVNPLTDVREFRVSSADGRARTHYPIGTWKMPGAAGAGAIAPPRGDAISGTGVPSGA